MKLAIGICTRGRPEGLATLLQSIDRCTRPDGVDLILVIVENEARATLDRDDLAGLTDLPIAFHVEPRLGVADVRNRLLDEVEDLGADWLAGVDDDETVRPDWLTAYVAAMAALPEARVLIGHCHRHPGPDQSGYFRQRSAPLAPFGARAHRASTTNYAIHRQIFSGPEGLGLRFDPFFNEIGGEGIEFFGRVAAVHGHQPLSVPGAQSDELHDGIRSRLAYYLETQRKAAYIGLASRQRLRRVHGTLSPGKEAANALQQVNRNVILGLGAALGCLPLLLLSRRRGRLLAGEAAARAYRLLGMVDFLRGRTRPLYGRNARTEAAA